MYKNNFWVVNFSEDPCEFVPLPQIVFLVTGYNNAPYLNSCLSSIINQKGDNWKCIIIDDASSDSSWRIISGFYKKFPLRFLIFRNKERKWKMENFVNAVKMCETDDVIIELDGDDFLLNDNVAQELSELHRKFDVVWTQHEIDYKIFPNWHTWYSTTLPENWTRLEPSRLTLWTKNMHPGHLRSFKRKYFDLICEKDLKWNNEYVKACADAAYYTPIIESTPPWLRYHYARKCVRYRITESSDTLLEHFSRGISEIEKQTAVASWIKSKSPYKQLNINYIYIPVYHHKDLRLAIKLMNWIHEKFPFAKILIGLPSSKNIKIPKTCGIFFAFDIKRIMLNLNSNYLKIDFSKISYECLFLLSSVNYLFKNTNFDHLIILTNLSVFFNQREKMDLTRMLLPEGTKYLKKTHRNIMNVTDYLKGKKNENFIRKFFT